MLGTYATEYLNAEGLCRDDFDARTNFPMNFTKNDIVVNCVGILKPFIDKVGIADTIRINSVFPQAVSDACKSSGAKFIHICSDCVFSGTKGMYVESDICDSTDIYAKTKSIHPEYGTIIRSSIIGEDSNSDGCGFIKWVFDSTGKQIIGYDNCMWNGVTCLQLIKVIKHMIDNNIWWNGVRHIYSPEAVSKYELCLLVKDLYNLDIEITKGIAKNISGTPIKDVLDRTLSTNYPELIGQFNIPSIRDQIIQQKGLLC